MPDLRYAFRQFVKNPGFTAVAVLTLALGIGACTGMFSILSQIALRPLPYADSEQLVQLWENSRGDWTGRNTVSGGVAKGWQDQTTTMEAVAVMTGANANLTGTEHPARLRGLKVSANYLDVLRIQPALGRDFAPEEGKAGNSDVVIISYPAWQNYFGGAPSVVGSSVRLGERSVMVAGVLPLGARLSADVDFLLPFAHNTPGWSAAFAGHNLLALGRLRSGVTVEQVRKEMATITERLRPQYPTFKKEWGTLVVPLQEEVVGALRPQLILLFGATFCVLLIACANVAGLLLARAVARRKEMALRLALGASRWSVVRQLLAENLLLALVGGGLGVLLACWSVSLFESWRPAEFAQGLPVHVDASTLAFALGVSLLTGLLTGLAPAWRLSGAESVELKSGNRSSGGGAHSRLRGALIVGQVALSLILLMGAGLMSRSLARLQSVPLGFDPSGVLLADLTLDPAAADNADKRVRYLDEIVQKVGALPGVESAAFAPFLPLQSSYTETVKADGLESEGALSSLNFLQGDYLKTMQIALRSGRAFSGADNQTGAPPTAIINKNLASRIFPGVDPVGKRVLLLGKTYEVIGVADDVLVRGVERGPMPLIYLPEAFSRSINNTLIVRAKVPPLSLAKTVQTAVLSVSSDQPVSNLRTYDNVIERLNFARRLMLGLLGLFSGIALVLAAVGLYGIVAFSVERRTQELGIRSALGATRETLFLLVIRSGLKLVVAGVCIGLVGSYFLSRFVSSYLFGVTATDPATLVLSATILLAVAVLACLLPARRATCVDPVIALRSE